MINGTFRVRLEKAIAALPNNGNVKRVALFGSRLHGDMHEGSDVDLLVELKTPVGYFELSGMELFLKEKLGMDVDFVTPAELSPYIRNDVIASAETVYEK